MTQPHLSFWKDLAGKVGAPIFSATLVGCLLAEEATPMHWTLLSIGLGLIFLSHRWAYHAQEE